MTDDERLGAVADRLIDQLQITNAGGALTQDIEDKAFLLALVTMQEQRVADGITAILDAYDDDPEWFETQEYLLSITDGDDDSEAQFADENGEQMNSIDENGYTLDDLLFAAANALEYRGAPSEEEESDQSIIKSLVYHLKNQRAENVALREVVEGFASLRPAFVPPEYSGLELARKIYDAINAEAREALAKLGGEGS